MSFPACVPELTDGVVRLRAHAEGDLDRIVEQASDPESLRWTTVPQPYGVEQAREFLDLIRTNWEGSGSNLMWALTDANDPEDSFQGTIDIRSRGGGLAAVGYGLHPQGRGRHLMAGALRLVRDWWFDTQGGARLTWAAFGGNLGSWAVARAAGFRFETVNPRCATLRTGEIVDEWHGSIDAGDPREPGTPWFTPPRIAAGPVVLRDWREEDLAAIEPHDHPSHWLPARGIPDPGSFPAWLARRRMYAARGAVQGWCIADAANDTALGDVAVFATGDALTVGGTGNLGYWLSPSARRRGLLTPAVHAAVAHAFAPVAPGDLTGASGLGQRRLVAETAADNAGSNRALERAGFTVWGEEAAADAPDGSVGPARHWELLNPTA